MDLVIIRPRGYDFLYSPDEMAVMFHDIRCAREAGADGIVIAAAGPMDITFHRAFDRTRHLVEAMETIIGLGIR